MERQPEFPREKPSWGFWVRPLTGKKRNVPFPGSRSEKTNGGGNGTLPGNGTKKSSNGVRWGEKKCMKFGENREGRSGCRAEARARPKKRNPPFVGGERTKKREGTVGSAQRSRRRRKEHFPDPPPPRKKKFFKQIDPGKKSFLR